MAYEWYSKDGKELIEVRDAEGQYIIPNSVEKIYPMGLYACYELTSVIIPGTVKVIGDSAFESCRGLSSVVVPNSVTEIKKQTFMGCM